MTFNRRVFNRRVFNAGPDVEVQADVAQISLTGHAPTLEAAQDAPTAAVSVSGLAPDLGLGVTPPAGQIAVEGLDPTVSVTGDVEIAVDVASIAVTGLAPTIATSVPAPSSRRPVFTPQPAPDVLIRPDSGVIRVRPKSPALAVELSPTLEPLPDLPRDVEAEELLLLA